MSECTVAVHKAPARRSLLAMALGVPLPLVMLLATLALGLASGLDSAALIHAVDAGFGGSLGEFALILIPSFTLAAALSRSGAAAGSGRIATVLAPFAGAGMVCPDTAYAALSPMAAGRKLSLVFGAYAGFKLLVPAGPAIVATALGGLNNRLAVVAVPVFIVAWIVGLLYARHFERRAGDGTPPAKGRLSGRMAAPLGTIILLLAAGFTVRGRVELSPLVDFLLTPKGALLVAAVIALVPLAAEERTQALDSGMRRTAPLLLTIGAASALGAMLVQTVPVTRWAEALVSTGLVLPALFVFTASFKIVKGSSMATFAGTGGIIAALLPSLQVSPEAAALAMCAGAFVTITPNDSLFWLVRQDAFAGQDDATALRILALGPALQGLAALLTVYIMTTAGLL
ncbi:putative D-glycerate permease [Azospirillum brasilense]|uniref:Putative D-glycerate permease n=1 Tax=Azospirillum brasilense TaxID=192 RepID=A0A560CSS1_AZOBR|nr:hypothetical protein [Azospirillum brasilense]TWA87899.1 putative D-glycerate permease [Azospirillum brasilense]